jgi:hypothetical protein
VNGSVRVWWVQVERALHRRAAASKPSVQPDFAAEWTNRQRESCAELELRAAVERALKRVDVVVRG